MNTSCFDRRDWTVVDYYAINPELSLNSRHDRWPFLQHSHWYILLSTTNQSMHLAMHAACLLTRQGNGESRRGTRTELQQTVAVHWIIRGFTTVSHALPSRSAKSHLLTHKKCPSTPHTKHSPWKSKALTTIIAHPMYDSDRHVSLSLYINHDSCVHRSCKAVYYLFCRILEEAGERLGGRWVMDEEESTTASDKP